MSSSSSEIEPSGENVSMMRKMCQWLLDSLNFRGQGAQRTVTRFAEDGWKSVMVKQSGHERFLYNMKSLYCLENYCLHNEECFTHPLYISNTL